MSQAPSSVQTPLTTPLETDSFRLTRDGAVARLTLCRPEKRNALPPAFWRAFPEAVRALDDAGGVRVLILEAEGPVFCAGMDVSVFFEPGALATDTPARREAFMRAATALQDAFTALEAARFPVIAAVQGPCVGAGLDMITACDLRYGTPEAWLSVEETNIGMMADVGTLQRLPKLVPEGLAREMAFTGERLDPARAEALGLYNAVAPDAAALAAKVDAVAQRIASRAPLAVTGTKRSLLYARDHAVADALDHAMVLQASLWSPEDIAEAVGARAETRAGDFADTAPVKRMGRE